MGCIIYVCQIKSNQIKCQKLSFGRRWRASSGLTHRHDETVRRTCSARVGRFSFARPEAGIRESGVFGARAGFSVFRFLGKQKRRRWPRRPTPARRTNQERELFAKPYVAFARSSALQYATTSTPPSTAEAVGSRQLRPESFCESMVVDFRSCCHGCGLRCPASHPSSPPTADAAADAARLDVPPRDADPSLRSWVAPNSAQSATSRSSVAIESVARRRRDSASDSRSIQYRAAIALDVCEKGSRPSVPM